MLLYIPADVFSLQNVLLIIIPHINSINTYHRGSQLLVGTNQKQKHCTQQNIEQNIPIRYKFGHSDPCCVYAIFLLAGLSPHSTDF